MNEMNGSVLAVITDLERQREQLAVTIETLRRSYNLAAPMFGERPLLPPAPQDGLTLEAHPVPGANRRRRRTPAEAGPGDDISAQLLTALGKEAASTTVLAKVTSVSTPTALKRLRALAQRGLVRCEGAGNQQRWHLGAKGAGGRRESARAAKEGP